MGVTYTPMIEQYLKIKKDYADSLVFFRLGDFYEMFFDDAVLASKELEIALTGRDAGVKERIPMCGVPYHSVTPYIQKLINKGYKVAIAEQVSEPGKGLVERKVIKLITPGMIIDDNILSSTDNNYIASVSQEKLYHTLAYADVSTGELYVTENLVIDELIKEIIRLNIKELILNDDQMHIKKRISDFVLISIHNEVVLDHDRQKGLKEISQKALGTLLSYLSKTEDNLTKSFNETIINNRKDYLKLDYKSLNALELVSGTDQRGHSLFRVLDKCETAMGSRYLKQMIESPLLDIEEINQRLDFVEIFKENYIERVKLTDSLRGVYDLKRISARIATQNASPKDFAQLRQTLSKVPHILDSLMLFDSYLINQYIKDIDAHDELYKLLDKAIVDNPPLIIRDGGIFKRGYHDELDELKDASKHGKKWLLTFESTEREKTGIKNLKVGYNRVFGYYIEITKGNLHLVKDEFGYIRKQTLVNSERFINSELKEKEALILNATDRSVELEYELFIELREKVMTYQQSLQELSNKIAYIDALVSLGVVAQENNYVRPYLSDEREIYIEAGRHPVVEIYNKDPFIENDIHIQDSGILLITGPNMSGKSTYMRMFAIIVVMAQMGSYVPAKIAKLPIFDAIYTRIGAQDDLTSGQSTFMVEMIETNEALKHATKDSLLIFDEIGRGTATYDGMALAQGIIEYVHEKIKAYMLFSTHYHEITNLESILLRLKNIHVSAVLEKGKLTFLHKIKEGPTDKSYGINVAALAKLPRALINRSQIILDHLEEDQKKDIQLSIFNFDESLDDTVINHQLNEKVIEKIKDIDVDSLTPIEALLLIKSLQDDLK